MTGDGEAALGVRAERPSERLLRARVVMLDLDGCLAFGGEPHPAAAALLEMLGERYVIVTNNSTDTPETLAAELKGHGLAVDPGRIVLAGALMVEILAREYPGRAVSLLASPAIEAYARSLGLRIDHRSPDIVALARDMGATYDKLARAAVHLSRGADLVVSNPDLTHSGIGRQLVPETGALLAMLNACVPGLSPRVIGKPNSEIFEAAFRLVGQPGDGAIMVGDNPRTDGAGARRAGLEAMLVGPGQEFDSIGELLG